MMEKNSLRLIISMTTNALGYNHTWRISFGEKGVKKTVYDGIRKKIGLRFEVINENMIMPS
jgi:hypothetical protein